MHRGLCISGTCYLSMFCFSEARRTYIELFTIDILKQLYRIWVQGPGQSAKGNRSKENSDGGGNPGRNPEKTQQLKPF